MTSNPPTPPEYLPDGYRVFAQLFMVSLYGHFDRSIITAAQSSSSSIILPRFHSEKDGISEIYKCATRLQLQGCCLFAGSDMKCEAMTCNPETDF